MLLISDAPLFEIRWWDLHCLNCDRTRPERMTRFEAQAIRERCDRCLGAITAEDAGLAMAGGSIPHGTRWLQKVGDHKGVEVVVLRTNEHTVAFEPAPGANNKARWGKRNVQKAQIPIRQFLKHFQPIEPMMPKVHRGQVPGQGGAHPLITERPEDVPPYVRLFPAHKQGGFAVPHDDRVRALVSEAAQPHAEEHNEPMKRFERRAKRREEARAAVHTSTTATLQPADPVEIEHADVAPPEFVAEHEVATDGASTDAAPGVPGMQPETEHEQETEVQPVVRIRKINVEAQLRMRDAHQTDEYRAKVSAERHRWADKKFSEMAPEVRQEIRELRRTNAATVREVMSTYAINGAVLGRIMAEPNLPAPAAVAEPATDVIPEPIAPLTTVMTEDTVAPVAPALAEEKPIEEEPIAAPPAPVPFGRIYRLVVEVRRTIVEEVTAANFADAIARAQEIEGVHEIMGVTRVNEPPRGRVQRSA